MIRAGRRQPASEVDRQARNPMALEGIVPAGLVAARLSPAPVVVGQAARQAAGRESAAWVV